MANTTIPTRLYVVFRPEGNDAERTRLGFMSPKTDDAAFEKRKQTQRRWAYGNVEFDAAGKGTVVDHHWEYHNDGSPPTQVKDTAPLQADLYPEEFDNELLEGFQIAKSVRRYGWNGGNTVWRVADPRGFELEISSANFARIVDCTTIDRGVIQGKCVWGRNGAENILLPEASDVYQEAAAWTKRVSTVVPLKELRPGDTVDLTDTVAGQGGPAVYYGRCSLVEVELETRENTLDNLRTSSWHTTRRSQYAHALRFGDTAKVTDRYMFKMLDSGTYYAISAPKVSSRITAAATPLTADEVENELAGKKIGSRSWYSWHVPTMISPRKLNPKNITIQLGRASPSVAADWLATPKEKAAYAAVIKMGDDFWGVFVGRERNQTGGVEFGAGYCYYAIKLTVTRTGLELVRAEPLVSGLFGGVKSRYMLRTIDASELETLDFYEVISSHQSKTVNTDQVSVFAINEYWVF